jgi:heme-degrading monooxygenase HmoA
MFTRVVEVTAQPGKAHELSRIVHDKVIPILRNQSGFIDEIVLLSEEDQDQLLALSFWKTRENAEKYHHDQFTKVTDLMRNLIEGSPRVRNFEVEQSTIQKITAEKAA